MKKILHLLLILFLILTGTPVGASGIVLPEPGALVSFSSSYQPPVLVGIKAYSKEPFRFDLIVDQGDGADDAPALKDEITRLAKYFMAALTIPEKDLWVNLSPDEHDRIVPELFGQTEMGRDLLAQDYLLKQIASSAIYPDEAIGKKFWDEVYRTAQERLGTTEIPFDARNRVWIVPAEVTVYERPDAKDATAVVVSSHLKVMTEVDYLAMAKDRGQSIASTAPLVEQGSDLAVSVMREVVLPALEKEVNEGAHFARLRQIYHSFILASWYKKKVKDTLLASVYVDQKKVPGVDTGDPAAVEEIYQQYVASFKQGAFNLIKEEHDSASGALIPRKYFSGGIVLVDASMKISKVVGLGSLIGRHLLLAGMGLLPERNALGVIPADVRRRLFLDPAVSYHDILQSRKQGRTKRVLCGNIGSFVRFADGWPIFQTTIQEIDHVFTTILNGSLIDRIAHDAAIFGDKPFYVLDWGAGDLRAAKGLLVEMRKRGINNVRVIATTETIYPRMINDLEMEPAISMVVAPFQTTGEVLEKVLPEGSLIQAGYSKNGFHFILHEQWRRREVTLHFKALNRFFSSDGFFVFNVEYPRLVKTFYSLLSGKDGIKREGIWTSLNIKVMEESRQSFRSGALPEVIHVVAGKGFAAEGNTDDASEKIKAVDPRFYDDFGGGTRTSRDLFATHYGPLLKGEVKKMVHDGVDINEALVLGFGNSYQELEKVKAVTGASVIHGMEIQAGRIKVAQEYYQSKNEPGKVEYKIYQRSFEDTLPLPDNSIGVIFGQNLTISEDLPDEMAQELLRVLKPGGIIFLTAFVGDGFNEILRAEGDFILPESSSSVIFRRSIEKHPAASLDADVIAAPAGGIDLGAGTMDMFVDAAGGQVHFDTWSKEQLNAYQNTLGFSPVIFDLKPLKPASSIPEVERVLFPNG